MLVPFGSHVLDRDKKSLGTVSRVVLHAQSQKMLALVVQQGVIDRREIVVSMSKVARAGDEIHLVLSAAELDELELLNIPRLRPLPDDWAIPAGFDQRSFFLVTAEQWAESALPFQLALPGARAGRGRDATRGSEPTITAGTAVYDSTGQHIGDVARAEVEPVSARVTRVLVGAGRLFATTTALPASVIASIGDGRITLGVSASAARRLEPPPARDTAQAS